MYITDLLSLLHIAVVALAGTAAAQSCAPLPAKLPQPSDLPIISTLPDPFTFRLSNRRVDSVADWECRRAELKTLVQEYLYGYYPDRALEAVRASRHENNLTITVSTGGKSASFLANITFPTAAQGSQNRTQGASLAASRVPVVIAAGTYLAPVNITPFLESGVAVAQFDVNTIANDSATRVGAFWDLYADRDIGPYSTVKGLRAPDPRAHIFRRHDSLGLGRTSNPRRDRTSCTRS